MSRWTWLWFLTSALALLLALQVVITFNDLTCWKLALVAVEYGHRIAVVVVILAWFHWRSADPVRRILAWCNGMAALVLLFPLVLAWTLSRHLPEDLQRAFGGEVLQSEKPMELGSLWFGTWRRSLEPERLEYARDGEGGRCLSFFHAQSGKPAPCVITIHAGSWENSHKNEFPDWSTHWASRGYAVAAMEYRLAPKHVWPAQREDVQSVLAFLKQNAGRLGIDPERFILLGRSAGGQIALDCACELGDHTVRGCISLYGPADLVFSHAIGRHDDILDSPRLIQDYLGGDLPQVSSNYVDSSPYLTATAHCCPTLLFHGSRDILVWNLQSGRMAARLETLGVPHYFMELPLDVHGFDWAYDGTGGQLARYAMDDFMDRMCQRK